LKALRALEKRGAVHPILARKLKFAAYRERLAAQRYDPISLEDAWSAIPATDRALTEVALEGARLLNVAGRGGRAAEAIEAALHIPRSGWAAPNPGCAVSPRAALGQGPELSERKPEDRARSVDAGRARAACFGGPRCSRGPPALPRQSALGPALGFA